MSFSGHRFSHTLRSFKHKRIGSVIRSFSSDSSSNESKSIFGTVKDIVNVSEMSRKISTWTIDENESIYTATRLMVDRRTGCLCVTRQGHVVGILTEHDYLTSVLHAGRSSESTMVKQIATMDDKLIIVGPDESLQDCLDIMCSSRIRRLPIKEAGEVVALLEIEDIVKTLASDNKSSLQKLKTLQSFPIHDG